MSSSLNHYTANVQVTDAVMHNKTPLATSTFTVAVLAANVTDAQALIQEFYGRSGMSSKMINGVHTLFRSAAPNVPGAIRTVSVTNITLVPDAVAASTSAPAAVAAAPVATAAPVVAATVVGATPAPATSTATETTTAVPSVINATASPAATTAVTDTTTTTQQEVSAPTLKPGGRGRKTLTVDPSASTQTAAPVVAETTSSTTSAPTSSATAPAAS